MTLVEIVKEAILHADRCPYYAPEDGDAEPCDGLMGCDDCLQLAAEDVLEAIDNAAE